MAVMKLVTAMIFMGITIVVNALTMVEGFSEDNEIGCTPTQLGHATTRFLEGF